MTRLLFVLALFRGTPILLLRRWRRRDEGLEQATWKRLWAQGAPRAPSTPPAWRACPRPGPALLPVLPEPRRDPVHHRRARDDGRHHLPTGGQHADMYATQILAARYGLVWKMRCGPVAGSDGLHPQTSWTRFWIFGLLPMARIGGNKDHQRSAVGRLVAESALWCPAALLPGPDVRWEPVNEDTARATVRYGEWEQAVDVTVDPAGQPTEVRIQRWSNENKERAWRLQPFGGVPSAFKDYDGIRIPTEVEGGNHIGTPDYFPFFKARLIGVKWRVGSNG
ncbi:MAG: DUF6544 family protein [Planctomycetota bacterium]